MKRSTSRLYIVTCLFNLYAEYIIRNAGLEEAQAGIKIAGRIINNLRYADDTTLTAESEEELKSLLMKVKEKSEKSGFKLNIQKTKNMASGPITSQQIDGETVADFILGAPKSLQIVTAAMKLKTLTPRRLSYLFLLFFGTLHSDAYVFPFLLYFLLLFFSQLL